MESKGEYGRRDAIRLGIGAVSSVAATTVLGTARAAETTTLKGQIMAENGASVAYDRLYIRGGGSGSKYVETDSEGHFSTEVRTEMTYDIAFYKSGPSTFYEALRNQVPHIYYFGEYSVGTDSRTLGLEVPPAHLVNLRSVDPDGNPVTDVEMGFRYDGYGDGSYRTEISSDGFYKIQGASFTGAEFADSVTAEFAPSEDTHWTDVEKHRVRISGPATITAVIEDDEPSWSVEHEELDNASDQEPSPTPTENTTPTRTPSPTPSPTARQTATDTKTPVGSPTATSAPTPVSNESAPRRGFFANGQKPTFGVLENPFVLTVGGFVLSVGGILHQMVRGQ